MENLPPLSYNVFVYLLSFFRELLQHKDANRLLVLPLETKFFNNLFCFFIRLHPGKLSAASVVFMASNRDGGKDGQTRVEAMQFVISYFLTTSAI